MLPVRAETLRRTLSERSPKDTGLVINSNGAQLASNRQFSNSDLLERRNRDAFVFLGDNERLRSLGLRAEKHCDS